MKLRCMLPKTIEEATASAYHTIDLRKKRTLNPDHASFVGVKYMKQKST